MPVHLQLLSPVSKPRSAPGEGQAAGVHSWRSAASQRGDAPPSPGEHPGMVSWCTQKGSLLPAPAGALWRPLWRNCEENTCLRQKSQHTLLQRFLGESAGDAQIFCSSLRPPCARCCSSEEALGCGTTFDHGGAEFPQGQGEDGLGKLPGGPWSRGRGPRRGEQMELWSRRAVASEGRALASGRREGGRREHGTTQC